MASVNPFVELLGMYYSENSQREMQEPPLKRFYYADDGSSTSFSHTRAEVKEHRYLAQVFEVTTTQLRFTMAVPCVLLRNYEEENKGALLSCDTLEDALLERLTKTYSELDIWPPEARGKVVHGDTLESDALRYLLMCFMRTGVADGLPQSENCRESCRKLIVNMFVSVLNETLNGEAGIFTSGSSRTPRDLERLLSKLFDLGVSYDPELSAEFWSAVTDELAAQHADEDADGVPVVFRLFRELFAALTVALQSKEKNYTASNAITTLQLLFSVPRLTTQFIRFQTPYTYYTHYLDAVNETLYSQRPRERLSREANLDSRFARFYQDQTAFGALLSQSCLPDSEYGPFTHFDRPTQVPVNHHKDTEQQLWFYTASEHQMLFDLFRSAFSKRNEQARSALLEWIRSALQANSAKTKLWSSMSFAMLTPLHNNAYASDAFFINLFSVLLRFAEPMFTAQENLIDLSFVASNMEKGRLFGGTTFLLPIADEDDRKFIANLKQGADQEDEQTIKSRLRTELFLYAHLSMQLGLRPLVDKFLQLNRRLNELEVHYREQQSHDLLEQLESVTSLYLCEKATLTEPRMLSLALKFAVATATHLVSLNRVDKQHRLPLQRISEADFARRVASKRRYMLLVPETLVENVVETCKLLNRFSESLFTEFDCDTLGQLAAFSAFMMASSGCCSNPHLRATVAETLFALLPSESAASSTSTFPSSVNFHKDKVFAQCALVRCTLLHSLLTVFVSIELTSENVNFYQKLNYRHPMYAVIRHIWRMHTPTLETETETETETEQSVAWLSPQQRNVLHRSRNAYVRALNRLAFEAIRDVHQPDAPLALRFANCLLNDANYLLDEALSALARIKVAERLLEEQRTGVLAQPEPPATPAAGEGEAQGGQPRQNPAGRIEQETNVTQLTQQARAYNQLGRETIACIAMLSEAAGMREFMLHPILRDRVISMLNYFLAHLVGKRRRELAVKNKDAVDFNPKELVSSIVQVYIHLGLGVESVETSSDELELNDAFCSAVSQDAQSYSQDLLEEALRVLEMFEQHDLPRVQAFRRVATRVRELAEARKQQESTMEDAPEEFLDPILGTVMRDPVMLPSSRVTVDRNTIARHLLSDQTDPFNRQPLTMEQCVADEALRRRIDEWIAKQGSSFSSF